MSAKSEIIIKNITQAAQIFGLATNINIIPKTAQWKISGDRRIF